MIRSVLIPNQFAEIVLAWFPPFESNHDKEIRLDRSLRRFDDRQHVAGAVGRRHDVGFRAVALAGWGHRWTLRRLPFRSFDMIASRYIELTASIPSRINALKAGRAAWLRGFRPDGSGTRN